MDHARRLAGLRHRAMRKQRPKETPEKLLDELDLHRPRTNEYGQEHRRPRSTESVASKALGTCMILYVRYLKMENLP